MLTAALRIAALVALVLASSAATAQVLPLPRPQVGLEIRSAPLVRPKGLSHTAAAVTYAPGGMLIAWVANDGTNDVLYAARLRPNLEIDPATVHIIRSAPAISSLTMASDGSNSVVVWVESRGDVVGAQIDLTADVVRSPIVIGHTFVAAPEIGVIRTDNRFAIGCPMYGVAIDAVAATGLLGAGYLTANAYPLYPTGDDAAAVSLCTIPSGSGWGVGHDPVPSSFQIAVSWRLAGNVVAQPVSVPGLAGDGTGSCTTRGAALACRGMDCLFVHVRPSASTLAPYLAAASVPYGGPIGDPQSIASGLIDRDLAATCDGALCLAVYTRAIGGNDQRLLVMLLDPKTIARSEEVLVTEGNLTRPSLLTTKEGEFLLLYELANADGTRTIAGRVIATTAPPSRRRPIR